MSFQRKYLRDSFKKKFHVKRNLASNMQYHGIQHTTHDANEESKLVHFQHNFGVSRDTNNVRNSRFG